MARPPRRRVVLLDCCAALAFKFRDPHAQGEPCHFSALSSNLICWPVVTSWHRCVYACGGTAPLSFLGSIEHIEELYLSTARHSGNTKGISQDFRTVSFPALPHCSTSAGPVLYLDNLVPSHLESRISTFQSALKPGDSATLEFTTLGPSVTFFSKQFILCALPFLPRKHIRPRKYQRNVVHRTPTALLTSLPRVLELATAGPSPLIVEEVRNVSDKYATILDSVNGELEVDRQMRSAFIEEWGVDCWREHRLLTAWESGLLNAGFLMRWIVVVRK